jgi:tetratricopeptide (TPR) repeat protein
VVEDDPGALEAATVLAELLEKLGRGEELAVLVSRQLDAAKDREDVAAVVQLSLRLGALLEQQWDEQGALDAYHAALEWAPKNAEVLRQIVRLGMARDDSLTLGDALDALLSVEEDVGKDAVEYALHLAKIRSDHEDPEGAVGALEKGWRSRPGDARLRDELVRRYTDAGAWHKLAEVHVADAEARASLEEKLAILRGAADMLRERAEDQAAAAEILLRALEVDLGNREVLTALIEAFGATRQHARAVDAIGRVIAASPADPWLYRTRAGLFEALGRDQAALLDLERAYEKSGGEHAEALIAALGRATALCAAKTTPEARATLRGLRLRLAAVLAQAGEIDRARSELTEIIRGDARDRTALHALALLEESTGNWAGASAIYSRLVSLEDGEALVDTALRLADACERGDRLGDAHDALERARRVAPDNADVNERLRQVYAATGRGRELATLLLDDASRATDPAARFAHLMHAGRLLMAADGEADAAASVFAEARALRPDDAEATLLLADAYTIGGRLAEARTVLDAAVTAQRGRRTRALAAVHRRLARLDLAAGHSASALAALTRAFDNDAQNAHLAMELGTLAVELEEHEPATRAFRAVTLMKTGGSSEGATPALRALAYYHLGRMAFLQGDKRKARLMVDKAVADDPTLEAARELLEQLRNA